MAFLNNQEDEIIRGISEISKIINDLKKLLDSDDVEHFSIYKSRNAEIRTLPLEVKGFVNTIHAKWFKQRETLQRIRHSLTPFYCHSRAFLNHANSGFRFILLRELMAVPEIVSVINMGYKYLYSVACLNNEEIWTHGDDKIMRLYNFNGELVKSIQTKSGNMPQDSDSSDTEWKFGL